MGVSGDRAVSNMFHQGIAETKDMSRRQWLAKGFGWEFSQVYGDPKRTDFFYIFDKPAGRLWRKRLPEVGTRDFVTIGEFKPPGVDYGWSIAVDTRPSSDTLLLGTDNPAQILRSLNGHSDSPKWNTEPGITIDKEAIVSIAFAPSKPGMAYAVSGSGRVFRKYDVNTEKKWVEMGRWPGGNVTQLVVNPLHENRIYLMTWDKVGPSATEGKYWVEIPGSGKDSLPSIEFRSLVAYPDDGLTLFLAAKVGIFITRDEGNSWQQYSPDLPNVEVKQILWSGDYLYALTHGRGLWRRLPCL